LNSFISRKSIGVVKQIRFFHRPVLEDRAVEQRQHAAEAVADYGDILDAGILLHAADGFGDEVEDVVLHASDFSSGFGALQSSM